VSFDLTELFVKPRATPTAEAAGNRRVAQPTHDERALHPLSPFAALFVRNVLSMK
jgi:hypothetical protein